MDTECGMYSHPCFSLGNTGVGKERNMILYPLRIRRLKLSEITQCTQVRNIPGTEIWFLPPHLELSLKKSLQVSTGRVL